MTAKIKILLSHPTGNEVNRATAAGFFNNQILSEFYTSLAIFPGIIVDRLIKMNSFAELSRRSFDPKLKPYTYTNPWLELGRLSASKAGFQNLIRHEKGIFSIDKVYQNSDLYVAKSLQKSKRLGTTAIYAYEDGASASFTEGKRLGLKCFYDLPIGYWRTAQRILQKELEIWPDWANTLTGFLDSNAKLLRKDKELQLADRIFVASKFTADTLKDYPGKLAPIEIIPYGFPAVTKTTKTSSIYRNRPLKLLFVGGLTQRKGIANLFAAVSALKPYVELTVVGRKANSNCPALDIALSKHHWIPTLAHADILKLMQIHDVLVFPSLFEGFGLVITEAMSQGTPVITTNHTAGPDIIDHGENGWLIEAGSTLALQEAIENLLLSPKIIFEVGKAAKEKARGRSWEVFGQELAKAVSK